MSRPVPGLAVLAVRDAVLTALTADAPLDGLITGVFDHVPAGQELDYIALGESTETPANAQDRHGAEVLHTLHIWTRHRGFGTALDIAGRVLQVLDHQPLQITGHRWRWTRFVSLQTLPDPEPEVRHVPMTFRIGTEVIPPT